MIDRTVILSFLAGGVTGAALALLMAPQAGIDTRQHIERTLRTAADSALDLTDRLASSALGGHGSRNTPTNGDEASAT